jgi:two-component system nitrogen regulation sensor histidine kinase NtrY
MEPDPYITALEIPLLEKKRRKKEFILIGVILVAVAVISFVITRTSLFGDDVPASNTILMFILININMMLFLLLLILVLRNLVKLYYDRRHKIMGSKLRTKLLVAFISLTLLPTTVLFYFSIQFISTSLDLWFNPPVEKALENSLTIGRQLYSYVEEHSRFFIDKVVDRVDDKNYLLPQHRQALKTYIEASRAENHLGAMEIYDPKGNRIDYSSVDDVDLFLKNPLPVDELLKPAEEGHVRTYSETQKDRELIRSVAAIPVGAQGEKVRGFVVISVAIPLSMSQSVSSVVLGFEEYQQIKLYKSPIQLSFVISLSVVGLLAVFCAIWFAFYMAKSMTIPILKLAEGTRRVAEGDLSFNISISSDDEIGSLVGSFNKMTHDLSISREQIALSARMLKEQNQEIEERRQYMEIVLQNVSAGVVSLDPWGNVATLNKSAERMLGVKAEQVIKKNFKELLDRQQQGKADEVAEKLEYSGTGVDFPLSLTLDNKLRSFMVHSNALKDDNGNTIGTVIVFDDLTELEKAQRVAAWREVARRIAHEVKNPLTPIALSAERLKRRYSAQVDDPVFDECTRTIIDHVDLIRNLVNAFSTFARFPMSNPAPCDLPLIIEESVSLYRESHDHVAFEIIRETEIPLLNLDRQQIKQAMINLLDNAIAALLNNGEIRITMNHNKSKNIVLLDVADNGPGIPDSIKARLFEPYFSTKKSGTGLGLAIVNSIVSDHNGSIRVLDNTPKGTRFVIEFPV